MQIEFRFNQFQKFVATKPFDLGSTGVKVVKGMEILFDGTTAEIYGARYTIPTLRGAIKTNWIVPAESYDEDAEVAPRVSANIPFRPATRAGEPPEKRQGLATVEADERIVMSSAAHAKAVDRVNHQSRVARAGGRTMTIEVEDQGTLIPVRSIQTPTKSATEVTDSTVGSAIRAAEAVKIQPGQGLTQEDYLARMSEEDRAEYHAKKEALRSEKPGLVTPPPKRPTPSRGKMAKKPMTEGVMIASGGTEIYEASSEGTSEASVTLVEGVAFHNTNGPKRAYSSSSNSPPQEVVSRISKDGTADVRRQIATSLCPDFPTDYNFDDHWKRRVAMIRLNYETRFDVIRAIFAAESDEFKKVLLDEFPDAFVS